MQGSDGSQRVGLVEIARAFLKIGAMSYGGPAIVGIMETEIQERRNWLSKQEFVEGLALVNMLPGPLVTQLGILIGHTQRGLAGGILAGVSFLLPAFLIMVTLAAGYAAFGAVPSMRNAFYGIGPVVLGIYAAAVYRLGKGVVRGAAEVAILVGAAPTPSGKSCFGSRGATGGPSGAIIPDLAGIGRIGPLLLQGRCLHFWRRPFDARLHPGTGGHTVRLAYASRVRGRTGPCPTLSGAGSDARCLYRLQAGGPAPDIFTWVVLALTVAILLLRNVGSLPLVLGGGFIGFLRRSAPWERLTGFVPMLAR
jgi:chromate transport protein ChrA